MNIPEQTTAAAFPQYLSGGRVLADSAALHWPELYARRLRFPRVVDHRFSWDNWFHPRPVKPASLHRSLERAVKPLPAFLPRTPQHLANDTFWLLPSFCCESDDGNVPVIVLMRGSFALCLVALVALALAVRGHEGQAGDHDELEGVIRGLCARNEWTPLSISKYLSYPYPDGSRLNGYAEMYRWPGNLDRGLGKDCLDAALRLAKSQYGVALDGVNVNTVPDERRLNLYFFDPDKVPALSAFRNQCVYVGFKNIICCDAHFLAQFQELPLVESRLDELIEPGKHFSTLLDQPKSYLPNFLLQQLAASHHAVLWALTHEIGHLVHRHHPVDLARRITMPQRSLERARAMENEADEFALQVLKSCSKNGLGLVVQGIQNIVAGQIADALHAPDGMLEVPLAELDQKIPVHRTTGTHPPMMIRLLDAMQVFEEQYPDFAHPGVRTFAKLRSQVIVVP